MTFGGVASSPAASSAICAVVTLQRRCTLLSLQSGLLRITGASLKRHSVAAAAKEVLSNTRAKISCARVLHSTHRPSLLSVLVSYRR